MRARLLLAPLALALLLPSGAHAGVSLASCGKKGALCGSVAVPLDYSGATPGEISLHVEELPPDGTPRGALVLLAGGPGQASAQVFDLAGGAPFWQLLFPGYTLIAYDDRGTGGSGALSCANLDSVVAQEQVAGAAGLCGEQLGAGRPFYATRDHAEDIESVRRALGFDRIALFGVSYGTRQALAYASLHPEHVERIVLDSVPGLRGSRPLRDRHPSGDPVCARVALLRGVVPGRLERPGCRPREAGQPARREPRAHRRIAGARR